MIFKKKTERKNLKTALLKLPLLTKLQFINLELVFIYRSVLLKLHRDDAVVSRGQQLYNPKRAPDITKQSYYQKARQRLPVHLRQQFQTWHHLPVYKVPTDAAINKSSMFTQPHKAYGRHFTIHPEWGLHKPLVL